MSTQSVQSVNCLPFCTPIQNQGECGSCTAFGSTGVWEALIRIAQHNSSFAVKLSERNLFSCSGGTCAGGNTVDATLNYGVSTGDVSESCAPYDGMANGWDYNCGENTCTNYWVGSAKLASWTPITDVTQMKALLAQGPLVTTMFVHQSFMNYVSGVYHNLGASDPIVGGHCVGIVGYNDTLGAWLLRNSWGTGWGQGCTVDGVVTPGYCWIAYGDSSIDVEMYQLVTDGSIPQPPTPPPSPPWYVQVWEAIVNFLRSIFKKP